MWGVLRPKYFQQQETKQATLAHEQAQFDASFPQTMTAYRNEVIKLIGNLKMNAVSSRPQVANKIGKTFDQLTFIVANRAQQGNTTPEVLEVVKRLELNKEGIKARIAMVGAERLSDKNDIILDDIQNALVSSTTPVQPAQILQPVVVHFTTDTNKPANTPMSGVSAQVQTTPIVTRPAMKQSSSPKSGLSSIPSTTTTPRSVGPLTNSATLTPTPTITSTPPSSPKNNSSTAPPPPPPPPGTPGSGSPPSSPKNSGSAVPPPPPPPPGTPGSGFSPSSPKSTPILTKAPTPPPSPKSSAAAGAGSSMSAGSGAAAGAGSSAGSGAAAGAGSSAAAGAGSSAGISVDAGAAAGAGSGAGSAAGGSADASAAGGSADAGAAGGSASAGAKTVAKTKVAFNPKKKVTVGQFCQDNYGQTYYQRKCEYLECTIDKPCEALTKESIEFDNLVFNPTQHEDEPKWKAIRAKCNLDLDDLPKCKEKLNGLTKQPFRLVPAFTIDQTPILNPDLNLDEFGIPEVDAIIERVKENGLPKTNVEIGDFVNQLHNDELKMAEVSKQASTSADDRDRLATLINVWSFTIGTYVKYLLKFFVRNRTKRGKKDGKEHILKKDGKVLQFLEKIPEMGCTGFCEEQIEAEFDGSRDQTTLTKIVKPIEVTDFCEENFANKYYQEQCVTMNCTDATLTSNLGCARLTSEDTELTKAKAGENPNFNKSDQISLASTCIDWPSCEKELGSYITPQLAKPNLPEWPLNIKGLIGEVKAKAPERVTLCEALLEHVNEKTPTTFATIGPYVNKLIADLNALSDKGEREKIPEVITLIEKWNNRITAVRKAIEYVCKFKGCEVELDADMKDISFLSTCTGDCEKLIPVDRKQQSVAKPFKPKVVVVVDKAVQDALVKAKLAAKAKASAKARGIVEEFDPEDHDPLSDEEKKP